MENPDSYIQYIPCNFAFKLSQHTFGLDQFIPFDKYPNNMIFTGGLLYDILVERYTETVSDIDLFLTGDTSIKKQIVNEIIDNLANANINFTIGINRSVIYIFVIK